MSPNRPQPPSPRPSGPTAAALSRALDRRHSLDAQQKLHQTQKPAPPPTKPPGN